MRYCELRFAGREFTVLFHIDFIRNLRNEISRASIKPGTLEPGGILLGRGNEGAAIILGCAPQTSRDFVHDKDRSRKNLPPSVQTLHGQLEILGYYRVASGANPTPKERDLQLLRECLPESASLLLLIGRSQGGGNTGSLFVWEDDSRERLLVGKTRLQIPNSVSTALSKSSKQSKLGDSSVREPSLPPLEKDRFRRKSRTASLVWALAICMAGVHFMAPNLNKTISSATSGKKPVLQESKPLALAASIDDRKLRVTWDKTSPLIRSALSAVLSVYTEDREPDTRVLSREQLITGTAILNRPPGNARIRLVVFTEDTSELVQRSDPDTPAPLAPESVLPEPERVEKEIVPREKELQTPADRASSAEPDRRKPVETSVRRMTIGFMVDDSLGRLSPGKDWVPPRPMRLVQPYPYYSSHQTSLDSVQIRIRVRINAFGAVTGVESLVPRNERIDQLSIAAMRAARDSSFVPARLGNRKVPSTAVLSYWFLRRR